MAQLGNLDPNVEVNNGGGGGGITILPDDDYQLEIIESDVKANSKGTGQNLDLKVQVADGPHKGTWFFAGITSIQHNSAQAQAIGQGQLKALCEARAASTSPRSAKAKSCTTARFGRAWRARPISRPSTRRT
jgi:hypothetical protein